MNKFTFLTLVLIAWTASLSAQITREQANAIALEYAKNEITTPYLLYGHIGTPSEAGVTVVTAQEEAVKAKYACWLYHVDENPEQNEPAQHRYLFVKENDGNLLEILTTNDLDIEDFAQWTLVKPVGVEEMKNDIVTIYPNPTTGELEIRSEELGIKNVEVFDVLGRKVLHQSTLNYPLPTVHYQLSTVHYQLSTLRYQLNIGHLPAGLYFVKIQTETGSIVQKVIKQ